MYIDDPGTPLSVEIPNTDETWYWTELNTGDMITVTLALSANRGRKIRLSLLDENENLIRETWYIYGGDFVSIEHCATYSGTYYIKADNYGTSGNYVIDLDISTVGLDHAIQILRVLAGINEAIEFKIDVNDNGRSGLEDALFIIQVVAGIR